MADTLGLIAGSGRLPFEVADAAREQGFGLAVVAIEGNTDPAISKLATSGVEWIAPGELQRLIDCLKRAGAREVILAGAVAKRDALRDLGAMKFDARALALLAKLTLRGDDVLLRTIAAELESEGLVVVDSTKYLGDRLTCVGVLSGSAPDEQVSADLALGLRVVRSLGPHDVGQSVAVRQGTVLAIEAVEGTDAMVERAGEFATDGVVLVKAAKPGQDLRFDVPAIGRRTVDLCRTAGVRAIGLEAGTTLVLEREATFAAAEEAGIAVIGLGQGSE